MICPQCGKEFEPHGNGQIYCSKECRAAWYRVHKDEPKPEQPIRTFICANPYCRKEVTTEGGNDKRTKFCSKRCEKYYWKHFYAPPKERPRSNQDLKRVCPWCGKEFTANTPLQVFCCVKCTGRYNRSYGAHGLYQLSYICDNPKCENHVLTEGGRDRRYRFCCERCRKQFHWSQPRNDPYKNQLWHDISQYASWERKTNREE